MKSQEIKQQINQKLDNLTIEELTLVDSLLNNLNSYFNKKKSLKTNLQSTEKRKELIHSLRGKYAYISTSSEDFAKRKQEEIDWEERNR